MLSRGKVFNMLFWVWNI